MNIPPSLAGQVTTDVRTTAKLMGVGLNQAYTAIHAGTIPSIKIGTRLLVPVAPLLEMLGIRDSPRGEQPDAAEPDAA